MTQSSTAPDALLLLAPGCPHCPTVLSGLTELVKQGLIGRLEVVNLVSHPDIGERYGVRSVPWTRIGRFRFTGLLSPGQLRDWARLADTEEGLRRYLIKLIETGDLAELEKWTQEGESTLATLLDLLADTNTGLPIRLAVDAVLENLDAERLARHLKRLRALIEHPEPHIRIDGIHYLASSRHPRARELVEARLGDEHKAVRDAAKSTLEEMDHPDW